MQLKLVNNYWNRCHTGKVGELNANLNWLSDLITTGNCARQLDTVKNQKKNRGKKLSGSMFYSFRVRCQYPPLFLEEERKGSFLKCNDNAFSWPAFNYPYFHLTYSSCLFFPQVINISIELCNENYKWLVDNC